MVTTTMAFLNSHLSSQIQKLNHILQELMVELSCEDPQIAYLALKHVLHVLRDRLTAEEAAHFCSQLPLLIKGIFYEGWVPAKTPLKIRTMEEFYFLVQKELPWSFPTIEIARCVSAVMIVLANHTSQGEMEKLRAVLPKHLKTLLP